MKGSQELYGCFSPRVKGIASPMSTLFLVLPTIEAEPVIVLEAPIRKIMPDLQEICLRLVLPLAKERLEVDSLVTSCEGHASPMSCEQGEVPKSIVSVVSAGDVVVLVVSVADDVNADGMLAPGPLDPSQKIDVAECCDLDVAIPCSLKSVGCHASTILPLHLMERRVLEVVALPSSTTIEHVMPVTGMTIEPSVLAPTSNPNALFAKELCELLASVEVARPGLGRSIAYLLTGTPVRGKQKKIGKRKGDATSKASFGA
ncbi:High affinity cationic amino acid transporter 1 [Hordeum vulgare]|nr:High affinity cationic amino acid transporter 1 [Hordeum vulgare]